MVSSVVELGMRMIPYMPNDNNGLSMVFSENNLKSEFLQHLWFLMCLCIIFVC